MMGPKTNKMGPSLRKVLGLPWWLSDKESTCQCRRHRFDPWSEKISHTMEQPSPCATTVEPVLLSPRTATAEACVPRARALRQEKPPQ